MESMACILICPNNISMPKAYESTTLDDEDTRDTTSALIIALSVCYSARLQDRKQFEEMICMKFVPPISLTGGVDQFREELVWLV